MSRSLIHAALTKQGQQFCKQVEEAGLSIDCIDSSLTSESLWVGRISYSDGSFDIYEGHIDGVQVVIDTHRGRFKSKLTGLHSAGKPDVERVLRYKRMSESVRGQIEAAKKPSEAEDGPVGEDTTREDAGEAESGHASRGGS